MLQGFGAHAGPVACHRVTMSATGNAPPNFPGTGSRDQRAMRYARFDWPRDPVLDWFAP